MNQQHCEPQAPTLPTIRHDGWTGEKMAIFCETLAETAVVAEACDQAGMRPSGAYAARRRNPVFAAAWDAALTIARERLADTLLARLMEGNVEQIYKDGELIGERHVLDNRLGLAILRRLDRLAETGLSLHINPSPFPAVGPGAKRSTPAIVPRASAFDWATAVDAIRTGDDAAVAKALAVVDSNKVDEVDDPLNRPPSTDSEEQSLDLSDRCWWDEDDECWPTNFPPPAGFTGYQSRAYDDTGDDEPYARACTEQEAAILEADAAADRDAGRAEDEQLRDVWFEYLAQQASGSALPIDRDSVNTPLMASELTHFLPSQRISRLREFAMSILARFEERPERRGAARRVLHLGIEASVSLPFATEIVVHDLSLTGALLESTGGTPLPSVFEVQLPDDFVARATVVWSSANLYGCRFARPISPATLSAAQLRSTPPAPQRRRAFSQDLVRQLMEVREQVEGLVEQVDRAIESLKRR